MTCRLETSRLRSCDNVIEVFAVAPVMAIAEMPEGFEDTYRLVGKENEFGLYGSREAILLCEAARPSRPTVIA
ncbi:hypothetical protein BS628_00615 [Agrobacterium radiobacter]|jgi:hypothetical protein|nr:hypothetical protein L902_03640 [Agrobacterium radiobacter DSM 30147]KWT78838.1 hypothetical protein ASH09_23715 [Agrobacterium radiobacter]OOO40951.1 hypothetical protein BS628_00615 [Agrobacterium radiobacter]CUX54364.1 hypothetical protein AGR4B_pAt20244 [Agrobacterium tumefaciens str. CFBP 5621]